MIRVEAIPLHYLVKLLVVEMVMADGVSLQDYLVHLVLGQTLLLGKKGQQTPQLLKVKNILAFQSLSAIWFYTLTPMGKGWRQNITFASNRQI